MAFSILLYLHVCDYAYVSVIQICHYRDKTGNVDLFVY
jgi:hypothetical protein